MRPTRYVLYRALRRLLPPGLTYRLASRDKTPAPALVEEAWRFAAHLKTCGFDWRGLSLAEIGPGTLNPFSVLLLKHGAKHVDLIEPFLRRASTQELRARLRYWWEHEPGRSGHTHDASEAPSPPWPDDLLPDGGFDPGRVTRRQGQAESLPLPDAAVDAVLSTMVLQFIESPTQALAEMFRVLRPGGCILHVVDFRDHYFRYPLEMLTYAEAEWRRLSPLKEGRGWHNRLRLGRWLELASAAGFTDLRSQPLEVRAEAAKAIRPRLHADFQDLTQADLSVTLAWFFGRKP